MKLYITIGAILFVTACSPAVLCDREAQGWNKFDTAEDNCLEQTRLLPHIPWDCECDNGGKPKPPTEPPVVKPPVEPPEPPVVKPPTTEQLGNPGNDKPVGKSGEHPGKGGHDDDDGNTGKGKNS